MELKLFDGLTQLYCYYSANFQNVIFSKSKLLSQFYCSSLFSFFFIILSHRNVFNTPIPFTTHSVCHHAGTRVPN